MDARASSPAPSICTAAALVVVVSDGPTMLALAEVGAREVGSGRSPVVGEERVAVAVEPFAGAVEGVLHGVGLASHAEVFHEAP